MSPAAHPITFFISDVHLGFGSHEEDRERETRLLKILHLVREEASHLIIVGDLFDVWFDYRTVVPRRHVRTLARLAEIREVMPVDYLIGNHDFGHRDFFTNELGVELHSGDVPLMIGEKKIFIAHGDGKAKNDLGYQILKKVLRNKFLQSLYRSIHPDVGLFLASRASTTSRGYTDQKSYGEEDGLRAFAEKKIDQGYDVVIMGHRHKAECTRYKNGWYINLGDWIDKGTYGTFDGEVFRIIDVGSGHVVMKTSD